MGAPNKAIIPSFETRQFTLPVIETKLYKDVEIIRDFGRSGKNWHREGARLLWDRIEKNNIQHVVIYKLDRLSRSTKDLINIAEELKKRKIGFHSVTEQLDTSSAMGQFFYVILAAVAELERGRISEKTRDALDLKKVRREHLGRPPFGWKVVGGTMIEDAKGKTKRIDAEWIKDPEEQAVLRKARRMKARGTSLRTISSRLDIPLTTLRRALKE